jgi:cytochrome bd-type quinol oxidase subunit 2
MDLPLMLGLVVAFGVAMYVVMDGFDSASASCSGLPQAMPTAIL